MMKRCVFHLMLVVCMVPTVAQDIGHSGQGVAPSSETKPSATTLAVIDLPSSLSGRWVSFDERYSRQWGVRKIAAGKGMLYWWSSRDRCTFKDIPADVEFDGVNLTISVKDASKFVGTCSTKFVAKLKKEPNSKTYSGEIQHEVEGAGVGYTVFRTVID